MSHNKSDKTPTPYQTYQTYGSTPYTIKTCKHPPKPVKMGDIQIYGCAQRDVDIAIKSGFDVISPLVQTAYDEFNGFYGLLLWLPIADMTAPEPQRLRVHAQRLIKYAKAGNLVVTYCVGSHGRTGTVLATCIGLLEPTVDPIDEVRARHCEHAVETQSQVNAIFAALDREVPEKWQAKASAITTPDWVKQGLSWNPNGKDVTNSSVTSSKHWDSDDDDDKNKCDLCETYGYGTGTHKLHWFGTIKAHIDCYETVSAKLLEKQSKEKTGTVKSSSVPSADSPPKALAVGTRMGLMSNDHVFQSDGHATSPLCAFKLTNGQKCFRSADLHQTIVEEIEELHDPSIDASTIDKEEVEQIESTINVLDHPFSRQWTSKQRKEFKHVKNQRDQYGDLICPNCYHLIVDPVTAGLEVGSKASHLNCKEATLSIETVPLCMVCNDDYVVDPSSSDFCTSCEEKIDAGDLEMPGKIIEE